MSYIRLVFKLTFCHHTTRVFIFYLKDEPPTESPSGAGAPGVRIPESLKDGDTHVPNIINHGVGGVIAEHTMNPSQRKARGFNVATNYSEDPTDNTNNSYKQKGLILNYFFPFH